MAEDLNTVGDVDMAECDGDKVVTMVDVLQEQEEFEQDANAVLGASDDKNCTYNKGYVKRQALYVCMTCCPEAKDDPSKRAGICLACSLSCHESHECAELYTKRNFRCDCGNSKFSHPCNFTPSKTDINENNSYNQNFSGLYCTCNRPYPDPENDVQDDMIQCIICEDWLHASHLEATVPGNDQYAEMVCKECMEKNPFLHDYNDLAVNVDNDIDILNVTSEHSGTMNEIIIPCNTSEDTIKNSNIEMAETANEMNIECSNPSPDSKENNASAVIATKDIRENEVNGSDALESDTTEKASMKEYIEQSQNERKQESFSETSEKNNDPVDCDNNINEKKESIEMKEDEPLPDPSLEDNIKALTDLINETNSESIENNSNCLINNDSELSNKTANNEGDDTKISDDKTTEILSSNVEKTEDAGFEMDTDTRVSNNETSETTYFNINIDKIESTEKGTFEIIDSNISNISNDKTHSLTTNLNINGAKIESTEIAEFGLDPDNISENKIENTNTDTTHTNLSNDEKINAELPELNVDQNFENKNKDSNKDQCTEVGTETEHDTKVKNDEIKALKNIQTNEKIDLVNEPSNHEESQDIEMTGDHIDEENKDEPIIEVRIPTNVKTQDDIVQTTPDEIFETPRENKRKMASQAEVEVCNKKVKLDEEKRCVRPKGVKPIHKGATFWPSNFRQKLCTCNECLSMYKDLSVLFLIDFEDTVSFYENLGKEKIRNEGLPKSQYEKGLEALSSLGRVQQINALTEYNKLKDRLMDYLKNFRERKQVVKEADIQAFFAGIKPKREPDGVYFCK